MQREIGYKANDGTSFPSAEECKAHERKASIRLLENLSQGQVGDAIERKNIKFADAIEFVGKLIGEKRRSDGDLKRKKKANDPAPSGPSGKATARQRKAAAAADVVSS